MKVVFDSNIIIDFLNGDDRAREAISRYKKSFISAVTWMEVMIGCNEEESVIARNFLNSFTIIQTNPEICSLAVDIRKARKIKLPDALIQATCESIDALLITRNIKDFPENLDFVKVPYSLWELTTNIHPLQKNLDELQVKLIKSQTKIA